MPKKHQTASIERARLLIQQSRFKLAEKELRQLLAFDPENATGHSLLALCYSRQGKHLEATQEAQDAIHLTPNNAYSILESTKLDNCNLYWDSNCFLELFQALSLLTRPQNESIPTRHHSLPTIKIRPG